MPNQDIVICAKCGGENRPSFRVCHSCGTQLHVSPSALPTPNADDSVAAHNKRKQREFIWIFMFLFISIPLLVFVGTAIYNTRPSLNDWVKFLTAWTIFCVALIPVMLTDDSFRKCPGCGRRGTLTPTEFTEVATGRTEQTPISNMERDFRQSLYEHDLKKGPIVYGITKSGHVIKGWPSKPSFTQSTRVYESVPIAWTCKICKTEIHKKLGPIRKLIYRIFS